MQVTLAASKGNETTPSGSLPWMGGTGRQSSAMVNFTWATLDGNGGHALRLVRQAGCHDLPF